MRARLARAARQRRVERAIRPPAPRAPTRRSGPNTAPRRRPPASAFATPAAASAVSHTTTGCPFVATMERLSCAVSSSSVGVAQLDGAGGARRGARAAPDAALRLHDQLVAAQRKGARRACLHAAQAVGIAVAHRDAAFLVHGDGVALDAAQQGEHPVDQGHGYPLSAAPPPSAAPSAARRPGVRPPRRDAGRSRGDGRGERARKRMRPAPCSAGRGT